MLKCENLNKICNARVKMVVVLKENNSCEQNLMRVFLLCSVLYFSNSKLIAKCFAKIALGLVKSHV